MKVSSVFADEWQRENILVDEAKHVEPFPTEHSKLLGTFLL